MLLKDSKTKTNLMRAFAGESQARNRYDIAANVAKKEGLFVIEKVFKYTAMQEKAHAQLYYNLLKEFNEQNIDIDAAYPVNVCETTIEHLKAAKGNEYAEYEDVYKTFGDIAKEEGFANIASIFQQVAKIEKTHGDRFSKYYEDLKNNALFTKNKSGVFMCTNCGHIHSGTSAPLVCPVCSHPQGYFIFEDEINII